MRYLWRKNIFIILRNKKIKLLSRIKYCLIKLFCFSKPIINVRTKYGKLKFYCPTNISIVRAITFSTKTPEVFRWIDGFDKNDILWDIGANVGSDALYANLKGINVVAFEPNSFTYGLLLKNIKLNNASIKAYCIALDETERMEKLSSFEAEYGETTFSSFINKKPALIQDVITHSIDILVEKYKFPVPNHITIDTEGAEYRIIQGAIKTLKNENMKSIMVEIFPNLNYKKTQHLFERRNTDKPLGRSD